MSSFSLGLLSGEGLGAGFVLAESNLENTSLIEMLLEVNRFGAGGRFVSNTDRILLIVLSESSLSGKTSYHSLRLLILEQSFSASWDPVKSGCYHSGSYGLAKQAKRTLVVSHYSFLFHHCRRDRVDYCSVSSYFFHISETAIFKLSSLCLDSR